jgi:hypothetical protein
MRKTSLTLFFSIAMLAACSSGGGATGSPGTGAQATATDGSQPQDTTPTDTAGTGTAGTGTSVVHVEVTGGAQAGTYDSTGTKSDCNLSSSGGGATYEDTTKTDGVSGLVFSAIEGGTNPTKFYFQILFGAISAQQATLEISTLDAATPDGTATASLEDKGATLKWTIDGTTKDNVAIKATIECGPVDRR